MTTPTPEQRVRERAGALGFDACRFTRADPPANAAAFDAWLDAGAHAGMSWMVRTRQRRANPKAVLPSARSIVTLAISYHRAVPGVSATAGQVARYARARDYHDVLAAPLAALASFLDSLHKVPHRSLWYVDTGPILERSLSARAGLGFVGKHTNLISRQLGNWFLISEILTPLELQPDAPEPERCGSCTRCLTACPTGAITRPYHLDARLCISYLTIELRDAIPEALRPAIGNRVFGCDDCLAVCPWNRFAREGRLMRGTERTDLDQPDLMELLQLDDAAFRARFAGTPILRTKRRGLLRNVCVALGNTAGSAALPALEKASRDPEPLIAEHARWAIRQIQNRSPGRPGVPQPREG